MTAGRRCCWGVALLACLGARLAIAGGAARSGLAVEATGDCAGGTLPTGCTEGRLAGADWASLLGLACSPEVPKQALAEAVDAVLRLFDRDSAERCLPGFVTTLVTLLTSGSPEAQNQIVRITPEGDVRVLVAAFDDSRQGSGGYFTNFVVTVPAAYELPEPFPPWRLAGIWEAFRVSQDLSAIPQLPAEARCNPAALALVGCDGHELWQDLLKAMCGLCDTASEPPGLPCLYPTFLIRAVRSLLESSRLPHGRAHPCPHGLLTALLYLSGSSAWRTSTGDAAKKVIYHHIN